MILSWIKPSIFIPILITISLSLTGCDQLKSKLSDLISEPTPSEMSKRTDRLVQEGNYKKAISSGESYLDKNKDPDNLVSESVVNAYMASGNTQGVVGHLQKYRANSIGSDVNRDNNSTASNLAGPQPLNQTNSSSVSVDGASVTHSKSGSVVRAGDAVVVLPK